MSMCPWKAVAAVAMGVAFGAPRGHAEETLEEVLTEARDCAKEGKDREAAGLFGDAIAFAHRRGDLLAEQEASEALFAFMGDFPPVPRKVIDGAPARGFGAPEILAEVLGRLDRKRCGAFVSAPCLAGDFLLDSVQEGDSAYRGDATRVLAEHARGGKSGAGLALLAKFASALKPLPPGENPRARDAALDQAFTEALREGWIDLAMAAGLETAVHAAERADGADALREAVRRLADLVTPTTERRFCAWLRRAADVRLKGTPEEVLKPLTDAFAALKGGGAGGAGGRGGAAVGADAVTPLGEALRRATRGGTLGSITRTKEGLVFRVPWDPKFRGTIESRDGVKHLDSGGLTVALADWAVALRMADPVGNRGQPGESGHPDRGRAFYRLARGESWVLKSDGSVAVGK